VPSKPPEALCNQTHVHDPSYPLNGLGGTKRPEKIPDQPATITVASEHDDRKTIQRLEHNDSVTGEGFTQSIDGSPQPEIAMLTTNANKWTENIRKGALDCKLTWEGLHS
jgi:hypothetical protein